jgi:hypothetical protein
MPGAFDSIASATVSNNSTTTVTFDNIPQTYKALHIRGSLRIDTRSDITGWYAAGFLINNDVASSGNKYAWQRISVSNGTIGAAYESYTNPDRFYWPYAPTDKTAANLYAAYTIDIFNYTNTSTRKSVKCSSSFASTTGGDSAGIYVNGVYSGTSAITRLDFTLIGGTFFLSNGSTFALYGVK